MNKINSKFLDEEKYLEAKKLADEKYDKHSAYKSMFLMREYK